MPCSHVSIKCLLIYYYAIPSSRRIYYYRLNNKLTLLTRVSSIMFILTYPLPQYHWFRRRFLHGDATASGIMPLPFVVIVLPKRWNLPIGLEIFLDDSAANFQPPLLFTFLASRPYMASAFVSAPHEGIYFSPQVYRRAFSMTQVLSNFLSSA